MPSIPEGTEMKKILVAALMALSAFAWAHDCPECDDPGKQHYHAMFFANNVGGLTVITSDTKHCAGMQMMDGYAYGTDGADFVRFCWIPRGDAVLVKFPNMEPGIWPFSAFEPMWEQPDISKFEK